MAARSARELQIPIDELTSAETLNDGSIRPVLLTGAPWSRVSRFAMVAVVPLVPLVAVISMVALIVRHGHRDRGGGRVARLVGARDRDGVGAAGLVIPVTPGLKLDVKGIGPVRVHRERSVGNNLQRQLATLH